MRLEFKFYFAIGFYFGFVAGFWALSRLRKNVTYSTAWQGLFLGTADKFMTIPHPILPSVKKVVPIRGAQLPTSGILSYHYQRSATHIHNGIDLPAKEGTKVIAAASGLVKFATSKWLQGFTGYGNVVVIENNDGTWALYAHLKKPLVSKGATVIVGDEIGEVGTTQYNAPEHTGHLKGAHLHFEIAPYPYPMASTARRLDPVAWLNNNNSDIA